MYDYTSSNNKCLLGSFQSSQPVLYDFWQDYVDNYEDYDKAFCTRYKNWYFFDQTGSESAQEVYEKFVDAVEGFMLINDKKFTELFKTELLTIDADTVLADRVITETKESERTIDREYVAGQREDSSSETLGERTDTSTVQVMAFNSTSFVDSNKRTDVSGEQENSNSYTRGEQTDTEDVTDTLGHTITTVGSVGNPYENMKKFIEAWNGTSFYTDIFRQIASELLLV